MADKKISQLTASATPLAGTEVLPIVQSGATVKVSVANLTAGRTVDAGTLITNGCPNPYGAKLANYGYAHFDSPAPGGTAMFFLSNGVDIGTFGQGNFAVTGGPANGMGLASVTELVFGVNGATEAFRATTAGNIKMKTAGTGIDFSANTHAAGMTSELLDWYEEGTWTPSLFDSEGNALTIGTAVGRYTRVGNVVSLTCSVSWTGLGSANASPLLLAGLPFASVNVANLNQSGTIGFMSGIDTVLGTKQITANLPLNASFFTFRQTNDNAAPTDLPANSCSATGEIRLSATYIV